VMKNPLARFPDGASFVAGLLIGLSILILVFAMMVAEPGDLQALWVFGALTLLAFGFALQAVVLPVRSIGARQRRAWRPHVRFMGLSFER
jgi:hypothetical protein